VPPIDPQAELWFQQALALDDPGAKAVTPPPAKPQQGAALDGLNSAR
jgi:hypothetical protein